MPPRASRPGLAAALALASFLGTMATNGLCFMKAAEPAADAHGCCKQGLGTRPPSCCMSTMSELAAARVPASPCAPQPSIAARFVLEAPFSAPASPATAVHPDPEHSPPRSSVLRI